MTQLLDNCLGNPKRSCYTGSTLAQRWSSTNPTCAYGYQVMSCVCRAHTVSRLKHEALNQCWPNMGPASQTVCKHWKNIASGHYITNPPITSILYPALMNRPRHACLFVHTWRRRTSYTISASR